MEEKVNDEAGPECAELRVLLAPLMTGVRMKADRRLTELLLLLLLYDWTLFYHPSVQLMGVCDAATVRARSPWCWKPAGRNSSVAEKRGSQTVHLTFAGLCPHI